MGSALGFQAGTALALYPRMDRCECGLTYQAFRSIRVADYGDAYHQIAWTREHVTRTAVLRHWARMKREDWAYHVDTCGFGETDGPLPEEGDASFDVASFDAPPSDGWDEWGGDPLHEECASAALGCPESPASPPELPNDVRTPERATAASVAGLARCQAPCDPRPHGRVLCSRGLRWVRPDRNGLDRGQRTPRWLDGTGRRGLLPRVRGPPNHGRK